MVVDLYAGRSGGKGEVTCGGDIVVTDLKAGISGGKAGE